MSGFTISRRKMLAGSAMLLASTAMPTLGWTQTPKKGGRLVVAADSEPRNLNPAIVASNGVFFIASKIVEPLAEASFDGKDGLTPRLATCWEGAADGLSVTFKLREGVKWHDGKPFTSADVAFSALQVWKPLQNLGRIVFKDSQAVDTPDAATAVFRFAKPTPFQLIKNALPALTSVLPQPPLRGHRDRPEPGQHGAGRHRPVQVRRVQAGRILPARPKTHLLGQGPAVSRRDHLPGAAGRARHHGRDGSQGDPARGLLGRTAGRTRRISKVPGVVISKGYEGMTYQLTVEINHRRKELADLSVRQAIAHAIDKDFVVKTIFLGYAATATGPVPKIDTQFYTADVPAYPFDVAKANALLDEAGYKRGSDGIRFR